MAADNGDTLTPVSQWAYPFPQKNASGTVDPDAYLAGLQGSDGPFPLGLNGLWHGGIHLDQAGASLTAADSAMDRSGGVRCIADGVVVAYRLDSDYQHLTYPDNSTALYSRSFTLVKHKLTLPAAPSNAPNAPNVPTTAPANNEPNKLSTDPADSLVFFSLYMHLAPCTVYQHSEQDKNKKTWPGYYNAEPLYTVSDQRATDKQEHVETGDPVKGSHVHRDNHNHAGENIGILPSGSKVKIQRPAHAPKNWGRIASILSGDIAPLEPGTAVPPDASHGWVFLPWLDSEIDPAALDSVYVLPKPAHIGAGEVVGYLGEYQNAEHASTLPPSPKRALLHVEVFAGDDLQAFIGRSRARAAQLTQEPKTQLVLSKGANLYGYKTDGDLTLPANTVVKLASDAPQTGMWTKVQVKAAGAGSATNYWIVRSELASNGARRAWNSFPLSLSGAPTGTSDYARVINIAGLPEHVDDQKHTWYEVDAGDATMNTVNGFVCASGQPNVSLQNKWAWAGFELLSSNLTTADLYKRFLYLAGDNATPDEQAAFEASFNTAKSDALIAKLDEILTPKSQAQGKVGGQDLLAALGLKWRANRVDHLVVKYESEWGGSMSKWDALDPFMHDGLPYWTKEKERIKLLQMWDSCQAALQPVSTPSVYHFHPAGIVGNFSSAGFKCVNCSADLTMTSHVLSALFPNITTLNAEKYSTDLTKAFKKHSVNTCARVSHFLGQASVECTDFTSFEESLNYRDGHRLWGIYHSALVAGLHRLNPTWTEAQMRTYTETHLANNDAELGKVLFGNSQYPDVDYRGRGPLGVTWDRTYRAYQTASGTTVMPNPRLLATDSAIGCDASAWFWESNGISAPADRNSLHDVTNIINSALLRMHDRGNMAKRAFTLLNGSNNPCAEKWQNALTAANGWTS